MLRRNNKWWDIGSVGVALLALILVNFISSQYFYQIDLTADKRYTINPGTQKLLEELDDVVFVEVFLEGNMPPGFERLKRSIREKLEAFRTISNGKIEFKFTDPGAAPDQKTRNEVFVQLTKKGLQPTNMRDVEGNAEVQKILFPGAIISYKSKEVPIMLLKGNQGAPPQVRLNQSVEGIEYELASGIKLASITKPKIIGYLTGHGELEGAPVEELARNVGSYHEFKRVDLFKVQSLEGLDAIILCRPTQPFSEFDKFKLDQFVVKGGKALIFHDGIRAEIDSVKQEGMLAFPYETNLDDWYFRMGVRVNPDLVMDLNSSYIPMMVGYIGTQPDTRLVPWRYYPLLNKFSDHAITKNLDAIYTRFISSLDTVKADGIRKTPLVFSSRYSKTTPSPVRINFNEARLKPMPQVYKKSFIPVAYLLEGSFTSLYKNRMTPDATGELKFQENGVPSKVIIFGDGDVAKNEVSKTNNNIYPLGYDRFSGLTFANKEFLMNALEYLLNDDGLILSRNKVIQLRPLNKPKLDAEKTTWQILNLVLPLILLALFGFSRYFIRKKRFTVFKAT